MNEDPVSKRRIGIFKDQDNSQLTIQCFKQDNIQMAYQLVKELLKTDTNNYVLYEIKGACQMLSKERRNPQQAAVSYKNAMKLDPQNLAYVNNFACACITSGKDDQGLSLLQSIQNKWKHPTIFFNTLRCYQNIGKIQEVVNYIQKKNQAQTYFPDFEKDNGLIHSFLLDQKQNTSFSSQLDTQIRNGLKALQIQFINSDKFAQLSQKLQNQINLRRQQEHCYGIMICNQIKILSLAATNFIEITKQVKKHYKESREILLTIIQQIDQLISDLFRAIKQNDIQNFDKVQLQERIINQFNSECQKIRYKLLKFTNLFKIDQEFQQQQNQKTRYTRKFNKGKQYHFLKRDGEIQEIQKKRLCKLSLTIQKHSKVPLAVILEDEYLNFVYLKPASFLQSNSMNKQCRNTIQKLSQNKNQFFSKFYWTMTFMCKFYNYYGQNDVLYKKDGSQANLSSLNLTQFIEKVYPLFPQIPVQFDLLQNIGRICRQIHYGIILYLVQCQKKDLNRFMKKAMKKISKICSQQDSISNFILEILAKQQYVNFLIQKQVQPPKKQKNLDYFRWRIFSFIRYHQEEFSDKLLTHDDEYLIQNCLIIMLGLMEVDDSNLNGCQVLAETFCNCYVQTSRRTNLRSIITEALYRANHTQTALQKLTYNATKILKAIFT